MYFCSVIIPSRDGEEHLETTIQSLLAQTVRISLVVVDDHSIDRTSQILHDLSCGRRNFEVIRNPVREPKNHERIGKILNMGLSSMPPALFYMISGDDTRFPLDYIERVTDFMKNEGVALASGYARKYSKTGAPDGSGRIYTAELWDRLMPFLESSGWESGMMIRARYMGFSIMKYPVKKDHLRLYGSASSRNDGYGSYTLGNPLIWAFFRCVKMIWRKQRPPRLAIQLFMGHLEFLIKGKQKVDFAERVRKEKLARLSKKFLGFFIVKPYRRLKEWLEG